MILRITAFENEIVIIVHDFPNFESVIHWLHASLCCLWRSKSVCHELKAAARSLEGASDLSTLSWDLLQVNDIPLIIGGAVQIILNPAVQSGVQVEMYIFICNHHCTKDILFLSPNVTTREVRSEHRTDRRHGGSRSCHRTWQICRHHWYVP